MHREQFFTWKRSGPGDLSDRLLLGWILLFDRIPASQVCPILRRRNEGG